MIGISNQQWILAAALVASLSISTAEACRGCLQKAPLLVCVKKADSDGEGNGQWALKALAKDKADEMIQTGEAAIPGKNGMSPLCQVEERVRRTRRMEEAVCVKSGDGFAVQESTFLAPTKDESTFLAPKKDQQDGSVETLPGMTLWEWAVSETPWPVCGDPGQNEPFQGRSLTNNNGECDKINICHGNAGFGWNRITVSRESLGEPTAAGASGHAEEEHNKMHNKRADYFPSAESVPNPYGAGINGYLDENCNFVCPDCVPTSAPTGPTQPPTDSPTWSPTAAPTKAPTDSPTAAPTGSTAAPTVETFKVGDTVEVDGTSCVLQSDCTCEDPDDVQEDGTDGTTGAKGDPHFIMFNGKHFEFHGGCDLVLLDVPDFNNGQGLKVYIRTKVKSFFSYIERAVVQIGDDVLEVKGGFKDRKFWHNGNMIPQKKNQEDGPIGIEMGGFEVNYEVVRNLISWKLSIVLPEGQTLALKTVKDYMRVDVEEPKKEYFDSAKGMMGSFEDDKMLSRDGSIVLHDANEFGLEWQVRDTEPLLFAKAVGAQYPQECEMPSSWWGRSIERRLAASSFTKEDAELACAHLAPYEREDCIYDVIATNDLELAAAY